MAQGTSGQGDSLSLCMKLEHLMERVHCSHRFGRGYQLYQCTPIKRTRLETDPTPGKYTVRWSRERDAIVWRLQRRDVTSSWISERSHSSYRGAFHSAVANLDYDFYLGYLLLEEQNPQVDRPYAKLAASIESHNVSQYMDVDEDPDEHPGSVAFRGLLRGRLRGGGCWWEIPEELKEFEDAPSTAAGRCATDPHHHDHAIETKDNAEPPWPSLQLHREKEPVYWEGSTSGSGTGEKLDSTFLQVQQVHSILFCPGEEGWDAAPMRRLLER
ncbi:hypothetical protein N7G274_009822 [Stereocaulon virgatum]|uniref:Uncharacterized protein n=1 Tax=Stereocaulon virgatum TaxID=373712 RepID=A0ABR3ZZ25_9LECA